jgi:F0F1-type ATP synthase epsilon subunit
MLFTLTIVTPTSTKNMIISWLELTTEHGSLVIQKGHRPLITTLKSPSEIKFELDGGLVEVMGIPGGIAEIRRSSAMIVVG